MASTGEAWRLGRRPALDGVRGLAVLMVLTTHLRLPWFDQAPAIGVVVFFTLSGFLITTLLLERGGSLRAFYLRRAARLVPALLACVVLYVVLQLLVTGRVGDWLLIVGGLTYTSDYIQGLGLYSPDTGLGHLWSLAVEEQFYLLWPLALLAVVRLPRRWVLVLLAGACVGSLLLRGWYYSNLGIGWYLGYHNLETRADQLLIGCGLALWMCGRSERSVPGWVAAAPLVGIVALSWTVEPFTMLLAPTVTAVLTAVVLWVAVNGNHAWMAQGWLVWMGQRSYGIYLYHMPLRWAVEQFETPWWMTAPVVAALTLALAEVSWRRLEQPILSAVSPPAPARAAARRCGSGFGVERNPVEPHRRAGVGDAANLDSAGDRDVHAGGGRSCARPCRKQEACRGTIAGRERERSAGRDSTLDRAAEVNEPLPVLSVGRGGVGTPVVDPRVDE